MAKSGSIFLLAVLVVIVSLQDTHSVSAALKAKPRGGPRGHGLSAAEEKKVVDAHKAWTEKVADAELDEKIDNLSDVIEPFLEQYKEERSQGSATLPEGFYYFKVTGIRFGDRTLDMGATLDKGGAILSKKMFPFLNSEACGVLKSEFPAPSPGKFGMLCDTSGSADHLLPVTLLFAGDHKIEYNWQKHSHGLTCLPILALP